MGPQKLRRQSTYTHKTSVNDVFLQNAVWESHGDKNLHRWESSGERPKRESLSYLKGSDWSLAAWQTLTEEGASTDEEEVSLIPYPIRGPKGRSDKHAGAIVNGCEAIREWRRTKRFKASQGTVTRRDLNESGPSGACGQDQAYNCREDSHSDLSAYASCNPESTGGLRNAVKF